MSPPGRSSRPPQPDTGHNISTIPEDPDMITADLLTTKNLMSLQQKLANQGLRLSICASDLIGKSHEELVLLLIQLRRSQARLRDAKSYYRSRLDDSRDNEKGYQFR
ncbi:hypothetical protein NP493_13g09003 [Ridgeia piscesae]|uniref:Uncharacterized protein n=1 Tax=Ridgeia piscesae TaxID=27915 RepID=A0AAD9UL95_RIDPI|nr:hypothetical protein NP493_13g09003 [Ridgeia piscesae]